MEKRILNNAVIIFCRYPVEGKVKTRLAESTGTGFAAKFYKLTAEHIFNECEKIISKNNKVYVFYSEKEDKDLIIKWTGNKFNYFHQNGNELGRRMADAFKTVFNLGVDSAVIIGTDIPDITAGIVKNSFNLLENNDFVIGPTYDGGFYLLGMKSFEPGIFNNIEWSSGKELNEIVNKIEILKKKLSFHEKLIDVDDFSGLEKWIKQNKTKSNSLKDAITKLITDSTFNFFNFT